MVLGQLHLNDSGVPVDGPLGIQQLFGVAQPGHELSQGMLELAKGQERSFQLVLFNGEEEEKRKRLRFITPFQPSKWDSRTLTVIFKQYETKKLVNKSSIHQNAKVRLKNQTEGKLKTDNKKHYCSEKERKL